MGVVIEMYIKCPGGPTRITVTDIAWAAAKGRVTQPPAHPGFESQMAPCPWIWLKNGNGIYAPCLCACVNT
jgi:hypothetical protein